MPCTVSRYSRCFLDQGGFGWYYGQYLSSDAILELINGKTSQHILLREMEHGFGFPDYYGGIRESDGIPPKDFPGGEGGNGSRQGISDHRI